MQFFILDEREVWHKAAIAAARGRGMEARRIRRGEEVLGLAEPGIGFIRPHADPRVLLKNHVDFDQMASKLTMIQDVDQVAVYENKTSQWRRWHQWMPPTGRFDGIEHALHFAHGLPADHWIVSKADVGASSVNVRVLKNREELIRHIEQVFTVGVPVNHCSGGARSTQKGYVLLQEFIPHDVTWRVNIVGTRMAAFKRFCYPDRPVAQTGNVAPVMEIDDEIASLLEFSRRVFTDIKTRWCAIDILKDQQGQWKLIETSLAWPWPSPGDCDNAPFFGTNRRWREMWEVMFDEFEAGAWTN